MGWANLRYKYIVDHSVCILENVDVQKYGMAWHGVGKGSIIKSSK